MPPVQNNQPKNKNMTKQKQPISKHITRNIIAGLYRQEEESLSNEPVLQILGFEQTRLGHQTEIIIRLSDSTVFIDCSLIGPYILEKDAIICQQYGQTMIFTKFDIVKLSDYFSKIDLKRICKLRIIIRKIQLVEKFMNRDGRPQQVGQYFRNLNESTDFDRREESQKPKQAICQEKKNLVYKNQQEKQEKAPKQICYEIIKKQSKKKPKQIVIKIEDDVQNPISSKPLQNKNTIKENKMIDQNQNLQEQATDPVLTAAQVMEGKPGYFIGRLLRIKLGSRQTKDGPITVLSLGFIDKKKQLLKVNLAGRLAIKEHKQLRKGRCYYVKGFDFFKTQKMQYSQLKLKEKDSKIMQVPEQTKSHKYPYSYFHWDHENNKVDTENVDIIGVIDEIEQKATYPQTGNQNRENRQVIRIIVRNTVKTVKISFWAEQINSLKALKLKQHQQVIFEDIKKKKNMFLDFTVESNLIKLDENQALKKQFHYLIPEHQQQADPLNLKQLKILYEKYPDNTKTRMFDLFLTRIDENKVIYKICANCKKKVQKENTQCIQCGNQTFNYKFNCQAQFTDFTGTISCVLFDQIGTKIFGKTAAQINQQNQEGLREIFDRCLFCHYQIGIQNKNLRLIARSFSEETLELKSIENIQKIKNALQ